MVMTDPYDIEDRSHHNTDGDWIDAADREEARAQLDAAIEAEDRRREMCDVIKAATINARCVTAMIRAMGMQAENDQRKAVGSSMAYDEAAFLNVIEEEGTHWNSVARVLHG